MHQFFGIILAVLVAEGAGIVGSIFTVTAIPVWYRDLIKPMFAPPNWVFGPVWTILFMLMGIASYLIWKHGIHKKAVQTALFWYAVQLMLNILWSVLFFGIHSPLLALGEIVVLWVAIALTMASFSRVSKLAAFLLLPYLAWVSFASLLNLFIVLLN